MGAGLRAVRALCPQARVRGADPARAHPQDHARRDLAAARALLARRAAAARQPAGAGAGQAALHTRDHEPPLAGAVHLQVGTGHHHYHTSSPFYCQDTNHSGPDTLHCQAEQTAGHTPGGVTRKRILQPNICCIYRHI